jgi:hypothetical protein
MPGLHNPMQFKKPPSNSATTGPLCPVLGFRVNDLLVTIPAPFSIEMLKPENAIPITPAGNTSGEVMVTPKNSVFKLFGISHSWFRYSSSRYLCFQIFVKLLPLTCLTKKYYWHFWSIILSYLKLLFLHIKNKPPLTAVYT